MMSTRPVAVRPSRRNHSVTDGLLLVLTLMAWNFGLNWMAARVRWLGTLVHPPPLPLVENERLVWRNMRAEMMSEEELLSELRRGSRTSARCGSRAWRATGRSA